MPKRKGGVRWITAPNEELLAMQRLLVRYLQNELRIQPNNAAYGYVKNRDNVLNTQAHRLSKHIVKVDLKDFFPSITTEVISRQLQKLAPFAIIKTWMNRLHPVGLLAELLDLILEFGTLKGALPQGSALSPYISNLVMVEFDHLMSTRVQEISEKHVVYTRYADDLTFSSKSPIQMDILMPLIDELLYDELEVHPEKVTYLKNTHRCYITGAKLNKDQQITYGHEKKKELKHAIFNLLTQKEEGGLDTQEAERVLGQWSYLYRIEPGYAKYLEKKYLAKFNSPHPTLYKHLLD